MSTTTIHDITDTAVNKYFDEKLNSSTETPSNGDYADNPNAKIIDNYSLTNNNCTTNVSDALNTVGSNILSKPIVGYLGQSNLSYTNMMVQQRFIIPASLRNWLQNKQK